MEEKDRRRLSPTETKSKSFLIENKNSLRDRQEIIRSKKTDRLTLKQ